MTAPERPGVLLALLTVQVLFAGNYVASKVLLATIPAPAWATLRILLAAGIFLALWAVRGARRPLRPRDHLRLAGCALLGVVINQVCFVEGLSRTTASHSALINTTIPVATTLFAILLGRERPRIASLAGITVALIGVLVLLRVDDLEWQAEWLLGDLLTLVNALSFSLFLVVSRGTVQRLGATTSTAGFVAWGAIGIALWGGDDLARLDPGLFDARTVAFAAYIVVFATVVTYLLNSWALARVASSRVALFIYLQPVLATVLAVAFLGEHVGPRLVASTVLVFLGVLLATRARAPARGLA